MSDILPGIAIVTVVAWVLMFAIFMAGSDLTLTDAKHSAIAATIVIGACSVLNLIALGIYLVLP